MNLALPFPLPVLELTREQADLAAWWDDREANLAARKQLREQRQAAALKGVQTKRGR